MPKRENMQNLRIKAGFKSARAFAEHIGMSVDTYTGYEQGKPMPLNTAWKLADLLDCTMDELAGRRYPRTPVPLEDERKHRLDELYDSMSDVGREKVVGYAEDIAFVHPRDRGEGDIDTFSAETAREGA